MTPLVPPFHPARTDARRLLLPILVCLLAVTLAVAPAAALQDGSDTSVAGHWEGEIQAPGTPLQIKVDLEQVDDGWTGTIDIPQQGASGLGLGGIEVDGDAVTFEISGVPGNPTFEGTRVGDRIEGSFQQGPANLEFWLGREAMEAPKRPQEPTGPLPYATEEVAYDSDADVRLAGTLTIPEGDGPFPAVLLVTGSGPQDRDEALMGHRPFYVLSDHLTRAGIATLRVDDRGVGESTGPSVMESTTSDFADDALAGIRFLDADERFDDVGIVGHSEGGLVGPMAAARSEDVDFVVLLAGTGVPGREILELQLELIARAQGADDETVAQQLANQARGLDILSSDAPQEEQEEQIRRLVTEQLALEQPEMEGDELEEAIQGQLRSVASPWFRAFLTLDPRDALRQVTVPVLAVNGDLDLQVDADQNLPAIAAALLEGGNRDVTVRRFPGLNHLFQTSETGAPAEYGQIEETMSPAMMAVVADWILDRFGPDPVIGGAGD